jgi:hypothetical protein
MGMMARTVAVTRVWGSANGALALPRLDAKYAKSIVVIMKGHALDDASQNLLF